MLTGTGSRSQSQSSAADEATELETAAVATLSTLETKTKSSSKSAHSNSTRKHQMVTVPYFGDNAISPFIQAKYNLDVFFIKVLRFFFIRHQSSTSVTSHRANYLTNHATNHPSHQIVQRWKRRNLNAAKFMEA